MGPQMLAPVLLRMKKGRSSVLSKKSREGMREREIEDTFKNSIYAEYGNIQCQNLRS